MAYRYSTATQHTGASIGTIISVPKPGNWSTSSNPTTEGNNWDIDDRFVGWLPCDGRTLNKNDYIALYQVIGDTYGSTSTTFNLPDYRSRMLMGTGGVDGNVGGGLTLTTLSGPGTSGTIAQPTIAGSTGGTYVVNTVRQLPPGSEITPDAPSAPPVYYDVTESFLTSKASYTNVDLLNYGNGEAQGPYNFGDNALTGTSWEVCGFAKSRSQITTAVENSTQYLAFGSPGTSPHNTTKADRSVTYSGLDFTNCDTFIVFIITGNDTNGGERPNNNGEGIYIEWPDGTESEVVPSRQDFLNANPSAETDDYDDTYSAWVEVYITIPTSYRTSGVNVKIKQEVVSGGTIGGGLEVGDAVSLANPNAIDMFGIQYLGWRGGVFGGSATDTFSISTFQSDGFENVTGIVEPTFNGTISFQAGPVRQFSTPSVAPHYHEIRYAQRGSTSAAEGSPYASAQSAGFMQEGTGGVLNFDRSGNSLKKHQHYLEWGFGAEWASYGVDEEYGGDHPTSGSNTLVNIQEPGGAYTQKFGTEISFDDNRGPVVSRTIDVVNDGGVFFNVGQFTLSSAAKSVFDGVLGVRLQAAEELEMMQPYFRLKYIIKAW